MPDADTVVALDEPWLPDAGAPKPLLWQTERDAVVIYHPAISTRRADERVVLRFGGCLVAQFGYPNDEALPGHPLYPRGLTYYGLFEVLGSSWLTRLEEQSAVSFPDASWSARLRHFIVTFHDSTLECLADTYDGRFTAEPVSAIIGKLMRGSGR
jgi:hypothetical protein